MVGFAVAGEYILQEDNELSADDYGCIGGKLPAEVASAEDVGPLSLDKALGFVHFASDDLHEVSLNLSPFHLSTFPPARPPGRFCAQCFYFSGD